MSIRLTKKSLEFLKDLSQNNDRNWFAEHKPRYEEANAEFKAFFAAVHDEVLKWDQIEKMKVFRIYRDVRFSKNKAPYKSNLSGSLTRDGRMRRGGFFFSFSPGESFVGGGFWGPESKDLKFIRDGIIREEESYRKLISSDDIASYFGGISGAELKTSPKGYDKNHQAIDLIRKKQFILTKSFDDKTVTSKDFVHILADSFHKMKSYFDFMSEILVFDENGIER